MFPKTAKKSGTNVTFDLWFEDFLALQPPFLTQKYTFWNLDPCRKCRLSNEKITAKPVGANCVRPKMRNFCPIMRTNAVRPYDYGVQNQKAPQFCVGTNVSFEQYSKIQITAV